MKIYKKMSLIALLSATSITLAYYDSTGRPSIDEFDDQSGGPIFANNLTDLEKAVQKDQTSDKSTNSTSTPSRQNPIPTAQTQKPEDQLLAQKQKFDNAVKTLNDACENLIAYQNKLTPIIETVSDVLQDYKQKRNDARQWTNWQFIEVGVTVGSGMAAVVHLLTEPRDAGWAIIAVLTSLSGGFITKKSREAQIEQCNAHEQDPHTEDKKPLVTTLEQLAGALDEKKYNSLIRAYTEAYDKLSNVPTKTFPDIDTQKNNVLGAATGISTLVYESRVAAIAKQRELEEIFESCSSEQDRKSVV